MNVTWVIWFIAVLLCFYPSSSRGGDDVYPSKIPKSQLEEAKHLKNPVPDNNENVKMGKDTFNSRAVCWACHGNDGRAGEGINIQACNPPATDLRSAELYKVRTDGELFWVTRHGIPETCMVPLPSSISDIDIWRVVLYLRTIAGKK